LSAYSEVLLGLTRVQNGDCAGGWNILWEQTRIGSPEASIALLTSISLTMLPPFRRDEQNSISTLTDFLAVESILVDGELEGYGKLADLSVAYDLRGQYLKNLWPEGDAGFVECTGVQVATNCYSRAKMLSLSPSLSEVETLVDASIARGIKATCESRE